MKNLKKKKKKHKMKVYFILLFKKMNMILVAKLDTTVIRCTIIRQKKKIRFWMKVLHREAVAERITSWSLETRFTY